MPLTTETAPDTGTMPAPDRMTVFSFGDPTPVLDSRGILDYIECGTIDRYYEPPVSLEGLSKTTRSNVYLKSGLQFKANMLTRTFVPHRLMSRPVFEQLATDYVHFGMAYVERRDSMLGQPLSLQVPLAKYMRRGVDAGVFFQIADWRSLHEFRAGSVYQLRAADVDQEIYGLPEWLAGLQSALLNESATLFRRKYYNNGSHAGFILYLTDPQQSQEDVDALRNAMKGAKAKDLADLEALVSAAVGANPQRGDVVKIVTRSFEPVTVEATPFYETPWFAMVVRNGAAVLAVLLVLLLGVRPVIKAMRGDKPAKAKKGKKGDAADTADEAPAQTALPAHNTLTAIPGTDGVAVEVSRADLLARQLGLAQRIVAEKPESAVHVLRQMLAEPAPEAQTKAA